MKMRYAFRSLARFPVLAITAVFTMGLCIGANTTIFNLINAFYQHLPVAGANRIAGVYTSSEVLGAYGRTSYLDYLDYKEKNVVFSDLSADSSFGAGLSVGGDSQWAWGAVVSGNYFSLLGVNAALGRTLSLDEDRPGGPRVAVLSQVLWKRRFGGDPAVVGRPFKLNGQDFTVIGVMPESFLGTTAFFRPALWIPIHHYGVVGSTDRLQDRTNRWVTMLGRLKPGITLDSAQADFARMAAQLEQAYPEPNSKRRVQLVTATLMPPSAREWYLPTAKLLMAAVSLLLLIAAANVANLLLAKTAARRAEIGTRLALGVSRSGLIFQSLTESALLSLGGGILGLLVNLWASGFVAAYFAPPTPGALGDAPVLAPDYRVFLFTFGICLLTAAAAALVPGLKASGTNLVAALKSKEPVGNHGLRRLSWNNLLVIIQVALSIVLLVGAVLLARSFRSVRESNPGYPVERVLLASLDIQQAGYSRDTGKQFYQQLVDRLEGVTGVAGASMVDVAPLSGFSRSEMVRIADLPDEVEVDSNIVGPGYFQALGIPLLQGRTFTPQDDAAREGVIVINESMVKRFWPKGSSVGKQVRLSTPVPSEPGPLFTIIGVVKDTKYLSLGEDPRPLMYLSFHQRFLPRMTLLVKTRSTPDAIMPEVRRELTALNKDLAVIFMTTLDQHLNSSIWEQRLRAEVLQVFGVLALALAAVGVFAVMNYMVNRRWRELGIRMALGATRHNIVMLVVRDAIQLTLAGVVLGVPAAIGAKRILASFLVGVGSADLPTFAVVVLVLMAASLIASILPAFRASQVNPLVAIRSE
jgi:predicted permease